MKSRTLAAGALAALCLVACATRPSTVASTSVDPSGGVHTVQVPKAPSTPSPTKKVDFIQSTGWGSQTWRDVVHGQTVTLDGGKGAAGGFSYALGTQPITYADANGDGLQDALVPLAVTDSKGVTITYLYAWQYDPERKAAQQVPDPVGEYGGCTNTLVATAPGSPVGFQITEQIRDAYDNLACSATPTHKFVRTVGIAGGGLVMTKPTLGYGGICYQTYRDTSDLPAPAPVRVAPRASSDVAVTAQHLYFTQPGYVDRSWPDGWEQVSWLTDDLKKQGIFWGVCGFYWVG